MSDLRQAIAVLAMAKRDLAALKAMVDARVFADEIFGFHVQQAVEKTLKAWMALIGIEYPLTHDISILLQALENEGIEMRPYWGFVDYNAYAVRFRYESLGEPDEPLDRPAAISAVSELVERVDTLCQTSEPTT